MIQCSITERDVCSLFQFLGFPMVIKDDPGNQLERQIETPQDHHHEGITGFGCAQQQDEQTVPMDVCPITKRIS